MRFTYATYNQYCNSIDVTTFDNMLLRINCNKAEDRIVTTGCSQCALNTLAIDEPQNMPDQYWMEKCRRGQMQKILQNHGSNCKKVFQLRINLLSEYTSTAVESKRISPLCQFFYILANNHFCHFECYFQWEIITQFVFLPQQTCHLPPDRNSMTA